MRPSRFHSHAPARAEIQPGVWLDSRLAVWFAAERLLVLADLHWGYAASHRARGNLLPSWGDDEIEQRLDALVADYAPAEMLWLGDIVHAAEGAARAERFLTSAKIPITLLAGNHDRRWPAARSRSLHRAGFFFHHGDLAVPVPPDVVEVVGHHHPAASWSDGAGGNVKLPALVASPRRLVLPAFSPWAAGTPWNSRRAPGEILWAIAANRIFALPFAADLRPSVAS
ncbi:MAG TPA: metallophosphoesterase [Opitutaceae bacterium]|nr:metallophosphoesterase [Opitutaceae bacterium]